MGTRIFFTLKNQFNLVDKGFPYEFVYRNMFWLTVSLWDLICKYFFFAFGFIIRRIFRFNGNEDSPKIDSVCNVIHLDSTEKLDREEQGDSEISKTSGEAECSVQTASTASTSKYQFMPGIHISRVMEKPKTMSSFVHEFPQDSIRNGSVLDLGTKNYILEETVNQEKAEDSAKTFSSEEISERQEQISCTEHESSAENSFFEEPKTMSFSVHGFSKDFIRNGSVLDLGTENYFFQETVNQEKQEQISCSEHDSAAEKEDMTGMRNIFLNKNDSFDKRPLLSENFFSFLDLEPDSFDDEMVTITDRVDSINECLSRNGIEEGLEQETTMANDEKKEEIPSLADEAGISELEESVSEDYINLEPNTGDRNEDFLCGHDQLEEIDRKEAEAMGSILSEPEASVPNDYMELDPNSSVSDENVFCEQNEPTDIDHGETEASVSELEAVADNEYPELEPNSSVSPEEVFCGQDDQKDIDHPDDTEAMYNSEKYEETGSQDKSSDVDSDEEDGFEFVKEHQDLIQQLKMEIGQIKTRGLPTILEESESPKVVEDLRPLKIDKKLEHKDRIEEIQKFYKSYADKMRKLDILNNQTMHALGLLRLKDPGKLNLTRKSSPSAIKSLLLWNSRPSKVGNLDPTEKFIRELHMNLEMVYVGQVCLSWEILYWQYGKAQELQDYESHESRQYNQVAGEYQQFQVLAQRFIENEPFQGLPRVQNYVENRYVLRNLLQVPAIRDDSLKDRKGKEEAEHVIPGAMLIEIIEASMHLFWEFIRADKDEANAVPRVELEDPADLELLMDIQTNLQKKDKKLKDLLRSKNCIVKRFQKHPEYSLGRALFVAQVELKLVSRVLNMTRLKTDQLVWCHKKLNEINFVSRKIHIEPSFLLFPC